MLRQCHVARPTGCVSVALVDNVPAAPEGTKGMGSSDPMPFEC